MDEFNKQKDIKGVIFDGIPRKIGQAEFLTAKFNME
jgi:hypothetical protein